jgi:site-specific DNA recombinase
MVDFLGVGGNMVILGRARVSTREQAINSYALEQQKSRLIAAGVTEILEDVGSGSNRRQLQKLIDRLRRGDVQEVVATRIDRITRSLFHLQEFVQFCLDAGVNLRILDQQIDMKTPHGKLMLNILGSLAQWDIDSLQARVEHGWNYLRQEKRAPGIVPFGYVRVDDRYAVNHEPYFETGLTYWQMAREIVETFLTVGTIRGTVRSLGKKYGDRRSEKKYSAEDWPREMGLKYWLCNPVIRGHLGYYYRDREKDTILIANAHEALISSAEYAEILRLIAFARRSERSPSNQKPLAGLVYCGVCGGKMKAIGTGHPKPIRWYCSGMYRPVPTCVRTPGIRNDVLMPQVFAALVAYSDRLRAEKPPDTEKEDNPEIVQLRLTVESLLTMPDNPAIRAAIASLESQIERLRIESVEGSTNIAILVDEFRETGDIAFWESRSAESLRILLRRFLSRVVIESGQVQTVELRF